MSWTRDDYLRLGERLRAARRELGYKSLKQFQDYLDAQVDRGLSGRTYADIEGGKLRKRSSFASESLAYLEDLFGWFPGATRAVLDGKAVDVITGIELVDGAGWANVAPKGAHLGEDQNDRYFAATDERLINLEERVEALERRLRPRQPRLKPFVSGPIDPTAAREVDAILQENKEALLPEPPVEADEADPDLRDAR